MPSLSDSSPSPNPSSRDFVGLAFGISSCDGLADGKMGLTVDTSSSSSEEKSSLAVLKESFREEGYPDEGFRSVIGGRETIDRAVARGGVTSGVGGL